MTNYFDNIEDYVNGELDRNALHEFELALQNDKQLRDETNKYKMLVGRLHDLSLRNQIKKNIIDQTTKSKIGEPWIIALVIAVVLILIFFFVKRSSNDFPSSDTPNQKMIKQEDTLEKTNQIFAEKGIKKEDQQNTTVPVITKKETQISKQKDSKLYDEIVAKLDEIDYNAMGDTKKDLMLEKKLNIAIAYLKKANATKARFFVQEVLRNGNPLYKDEAEWLLAISWIKQIPDSAIYNLENIASNPNQLFRVDAVSLLTQLRENGKGN